MAEPLPAADAPAPLRVLHNPLLGRYAATLCCIVHNEMFFLEAFLRYYRGLGVDRFIVLDDRSTDETAAFLARQPDVMIVGSDIRYFEQVAYPPETLARIRETRAVRLWRDQLMDQFCEGQWAVAVDPDEFLALPDGGLPALTAGLAAEGAEAVWGVMVDMYPRGVRDLLGAPETARFSLATDWFFDARPHLDPAPGDRDAEGAAHGLSGQRVAAVQHLRHIAAGHAHAADPPPALRLPLRAAPDHLQDAGRPLAPRRLFPELPRHLEAGCPARGADDALQVHHRSRPQDRVCDQNRRLQPGVAPLQALRDADRADARARRGVRRESIPAVYRRTATSSMPALPDEPPPRAVPPKFTKCFLDAPSQPASSLQKMRCQKPQVVPSCPVAAPFSP